MKKIMFEKTDNKNLLILPNNSINNFNILSFVTYAPKEEMYGVARAFPPTIMSTSKCQPSVEEFSSMAEQASWNIPRKSSSPNKINEK